MKAKIEIEIDIPDTGLPGPEVIEAAFQNVINAVHIHHLQAAIKAMGKPGHEQIVAVHKTWAGITQECPFAITLETGETFKSP